MQYRKLIQIMPLLFDEQKGGNTLQLEAYLFAFVVFKYNKVVSKEVKNYVSYKSVLPDCEYPLAYPHYSTKALNHNLRDFLKHSETVHGFCMGCASRILNRLVLRLHEVR